MSRTRLLVRIQRTETLEYLFDDELERDDALELVGEGGTEPVWSKIHSEDTDVIAHDVIEQPCKFCGAWKPAERWHQDQPVCEGCWDDRLESTA